jgi:hypothetical protein
LPLERLLTSEHGFSLTSASPLQRAICRIVDGAHLRDLATHPHVIAAVGGPDAVAALPNERPQEVLILSGIRTAKSLIAAATAVRASQTCDVSGLGAGETARVSVVSLTTDLAKVVYDHILGRMTASRHLARLILEKTADTVLVRHPSGSQIEIKIVAGARAGASLVARWSAGCIFDEAPRMVGSDDGVVNYDDCHAAVLGRLLPGAQIISIGSPWAPFGPIYERVLERSGKPGNDLVIVRAPAHHMNPITWTPQKIAELRAKNETVYRTDILGEFADPESSLFSSTELDAVTRKRPRSSLTKTATNTPPRWTRRRAEMRGRSSSPLGNACPANRNGQNRSSRAPANGSARKPNRSRPIVCSVRSPPSASRTASTWS